MMIQLAVFDLDCTLAEHGKGITQQDIILLRSLEAKGAHIVICSGKPVYYLCGMFRQVGLKEPIFIGEVGAVTQFGVDLPPKVHYRLPYERDCDALLKKVKQKITDAIPDIWFQPSEVNVSPFPRNEKEFTIIRNIIASHPALQEKANIYFYSDAVDFVPKGIDKGAALKALCQYLNIGRENVVAVGDSSSDYPMFRFAAQSYIIDNQKNENATHCVSSVTTALEDILRRLM